MSDVCPVGGETGCVGITEVTRVKDESVFTGFDQVGRCHVPAQGARAGDYEGLGGWAGGLEELADELEGFAKGFDEAGADMALAGMVSCESSWW